MGEEKKAYQCSYLSNEDYRWVVDRYSEAKKSWDTGQPNTASAQIFSVVLQLDAIKVEEKDSQKIRAIGNLTEELERLDKAIQDKIRKDSEHKGSELVSALIKRKIKTIDRLLEPKLS